MPAPDRRPISLVVFSGALRSGSLNSKLASLAADIVEAKGGRAIRASMSDFDSPSYDGDLEQAEGTPAGAMALCSLLKDSDGFIVASPEYNASMPGGLKNVIDWVSRCRPQPFNGRQGLLLSASPSMVGGNRGLWALRVPFEHLGARMYPDMFSLAQAHEGFDANGRIADATLQQRFEVTVGNFMDLVEAAKHYPALQKEWVEFLGERPGSGIDRVEVSAAH